MGSKKRARDTVPFKVRLPPEVVRAVKVEAARRGATAGEIVLEALRSRVTFTIHEAPQEPLA